MGMGVAYVETGWLMSMSSLPSNAEGAGRDLLNHYVLLSGACDTGPGSVTDRLSDNFADVRYFLRYSPSHVLGDVY